MSNSNQNSKRNSAHDSDTESRGSMNSRNSSKNSKLGGLFRTFGFSKEIEPINEEESQESSSSEEATDDEEIARENQRPMSTRTKIVVNLMENDVNEIQSELKTKKKRNLH